MSTRLLLEIKLIFFKHDFTATGGDVENFTKYALAILYDGKTIMRVLLQQKDRQQKNSRQPHDPTLGEHCQMANQRRKFTIKPQSIIPK